MIMLHEAWSALKSNRLRSFLTMLGMVIGVAAVIVMSAIGEGVQRNVQKSIASMGSNLFIVLAGAPTSGGLRIGSGSSSTLTVMDAQAIGEINGVSAVAPNAPGSAQLVYGSSNWSSSVMGTTPSFLTVRDWEIYQGSAFTDTDVRNATRVALLGQTVVENLFGDEDPVGKTIRIKNSPYIVLGVLAKKGQSLDGRDQDDTVVVPITTAQRKLFGTQFQGSVRMISVQASSALVMDKVEKNMNDLLRQRHRIRDGADSDFTVRNLTAMADMAAETSRSMTLMLGAIASISLLVGGIGIMNIMLVSVTERTREIGIRMAIGAKESDVLLQFILEAIVLSLLGCAVGAFLGVLGSYLAGSLLGIETFVTVSSIAISFAVAACVGIFFGFYPARKAAKLEPIEALRYQ